MHSTCVHLHFGWCVCVHLQLQQHFGWSRMKNLLTLKSKQESKGTASRRPICHLDMKKWEKEQHKIGKMEKDFAVCQRANTSTDARIRWIELRVRILANFFHEDLVELVHMWMCVNNCACHWTSMCMWMCMLCLCASDLIKKKKDTHLAQYCTIAATTRFTTPHHCLPVMLLLFCLLYVVRFLV